MTADISRIEISRSNLEVAEKMGIVPDIHHEDFIFQFIKSSKAGDSDAGVLQYYRNGRYSAELLRDTVIPDATAYHARCGRVWSPTDVLDFASGYGCLSRHLRPVFEAERISTCGIHEQANAFSEEILGLNAIQSKSNPDEIELPDQDLIVVLSLFSHLPSHTFGRFLSTLAGALAPGGALLFTTRGARSHEIGDGSIEVGEDGFGFAARSEQLDLDANEYGLTVSMPNYVVREIASIPDIQLVAFYGGLWWNHQDAYLCIKNPSCP